MARTFPPEWYAAQAARRGKKEDKGLSNTSSAPYIKASKTQNSFRNKVNRGESAYLPNKKKKSLKVG